MYVNPNSKKKRGLQDVKFMIKKRIYKNIIGEVANPDNKNLKFKTTYNHRDI